MYDEERVTVFKFYDRRKKKNVLIFACVDLYCIYQSGTAGSSLLGSGWPVMHAELGVPVSYMGIISMIISGGTVVSSLFSTK